MFLIVLQLLATSLNNQWNPEKCVQKPVFNFHHRKTCTIMAFHGTKGSLFFHFSALQCIFLLLIYLLPGVSSCPPVAENIFQPSAPTNNLKWKQKNNDKYKTYNRFVIEITMTAVPGSTACRSACMSCSHWVAKLLRNPWIRMTNFFTSFLSDKLLRQGVVWLLGMFWGSNLQE